MPIMALRDAVRSWNTRQHLRVFLVGLLIVIGFAVAASLVALAFVHPGAFVALLTLVSFTYLIGALFAVFLLGTGDREVPEEYRD